MLTFEQFKEEMTPPPSPNYDYEREYEAALAFARAFRAEHCTTFAQIKEISLHAMGRIAEDLDTDCEGTSYSDIFRRYGDPDEITKIRR